MCECDRCAQSGRLDPGSLIQLQAAEPVVALLPMEAPKDLDLMAPHYVDSPLVAEKGHTDRAGPDRAPRVPRGLRLCRLGGVTPARLGRWANRGRHHAPDARVDRAAKVRLDPNRPRTLPRVDERPISWSDAAASTTAAPAAAPREPGPRRGRPALGRAPVQDAAQAEAASSRRAASAARRRPGPSTGSWRPGPGRSR